MTSTQSPKTLDEAYQQVLDELMQMFLKKHRDYGKGNIQSVGELGIALRVTEKIERIKNLLMKHGGKLPANESVEETWIDVAVYAIIAVLVKREQFEKLEVKKELLEQV